MTRLSKRELQRKLDRLETRNAPNTDAAVFVAPDPCFDVEDLTDVSKDGIRALNPETGRDEVVVPHHRPTVWWEGRIPMVPESVVAAVWHNMDSEQLAAEREIREEHDQQIPPILEGVA